MYAFTSIICSYVVFLIFRSFTKHKVLADDEVPEHKQLPYIDTLLGLQMIVDMFVNSCFPFFVCLLQLAGPRQTDIQDYDEKLVLQIQRNGSLFASGVSFFFTFCHVFVSWKDGPKIWTLFSPYFMSFGAFWVYLLVPCVYLPWVLVVFLDPNINSANTIYFSWSICFSFIVLGQFIDFFLEIRARLQVQKREFDKTIQVKKLKESISKAEKDTPEMDDLKEKLAELERERA